MKRHQLLMVAAATLLLIAGLLVGSANPFLATALITVMALPLILVLQDWYTEQQNKHANAGNTPVQPWVTNIRDWVRKAVRSRRVWWIGGVAVVVLLAAFTIFLIVTTPTTPLALPTATVQSISLPVEAGTPVPFSGKVITAENVKDVVRLARWGKGPVDSNGNHVGRVSSLAISPDGITIISSLLGTANDGLRAWRVSNGTDAWDGGLEASIRESFTEIHSVAFSPNGIVLASADYSANIYLWRADEGTLIGGFNERDQATDIAFSSDARFLAAVIEYHLIEFFQVDGRTAFWKKYNLPYMTHISLNPNLQKDLLAAGDIDGVIHLLRASNGDLVYEFSHLSDASLFPDGEAEVKDLVFNPQGDALASAHKDGFVDIWKIDNNNVAVLSKQLRSGSGVRSMAFSPDGALLAIGGFDKKISLWRMNSEDKIPVIELEGHTDSINSITFNSKATLIVSGSDDGTIGLWGIR